MTTLSIKTLGLKTMIAALLAGSLAMTAGGTAFARGDGPGFDPAKAQEHMEKRVDKALKGTDATEEQKKKISEILQAAFKDMKPMHDKRVEARKALQEAMQAPTIDPSRIEQIRAGQIKLMDDASRRFTKALIDAGGVLNAEQRQAFFKKWNERGHGKRHG